MQQQLRSNREGRDTEWKYVLNILKEYLCLRILFVSDQVARMILSLAKSFDDLPIDPKPIRR